MAKIEVHGHRGARAVLPENTLTAFAEALGAGVDFIELDMGVTKDKVVVVAHDQYVNTDICSFADGTPVKKKTPLYSLTLQEVKSLDCGSKKNKRFPLQKLIPGEKIPTLEEVFEFVTKSKEPSAQTVQFNIETKIDPDYPVLTPSPEEFVDLVLAVVKKFKLESRIVIQSFDYRTLIEVKKKAPAIRISTLVEGYFKNLTKIAQTIKPDIMSPDYKLLTAEKIRALKQIGVKVIPWTVNEPEDWKRMIEWQVDGIITDDPRALISFLKADKSQNR